MLTAAKIPPEVTPYNFFFQHEQAHQTKKKIRNNQTLSSRTRASFRPSSFNTCGAVGKMGTLRSKLHAPCHDRLWRFSLLPILLQILQTHYLRRTQTKQSSTRATTVSKESASLQRTRMSIARSAILVMTVQQWSVIFINQQARETATGSESAREGKPTFDHQRHPQKNERCAGVIPRVFAITVQQWPVIFIKHQPRETAHERHNKPGLAFIRRVTA